MRFLKLSYTIIISAISLWSSANTNQDTIFNQRDYNNLKQGFWKKNYPTGKIAYKGFFKDDKPRGVFKRYHEGGSLKALLTYNADGTKCKATFFYVSGKIAAEGNFINNQKDSTWKYYSQEKRLIYEETYKLGKKNGIYKSYYDNGALFETLSWKDDQMHGELIQYFKDGSYKTYAKYEKGVQTGKIKTFYFDGKLRVEGNYKKGLKDGLWKFYNEEGKLVGEVKYQLGEPDSKNEFLEKESLMLQKMISNAGKIQEPDAEEFLKKMGLGY